MKLQMGYYDKGLFDVMTSQTYLAFLSDIILKLSPDPQGLKNWTEKKRAGLFAFQAMAMSSKCLP